MSQFQLGLGTVSAHRETPYREHPHVLRLTIAQSPLRRALASFVSRFPLCIQAFVRSIWPTGFLPSVVVVKKRKPGWDEEFDNEKLMYNRLRALQGRRIPFFYGEARCEGTRALVLSEMAGIVACEQKPPYLERGEFRRRIEAAVQELSMFGVSVDDKKLHNVLLADDGVVLVDMESIWEPEPGDLDPKITSPAH